MRLLACCGKVDFSCFDCAQHDIPSRTRMFAAYKTLPDVTHHLLLQMQVDFVAFVVNGDLVTIQETPPEDTFELNATG